MIDPLKHFDAPRPPTAIGVALALGRARWGVVVALVVVSSIVGSVAVGLRFVEALAGSAIESSVAAAVVFATLEAGATAAEAQALGPRIVALPTVASATLRTRDDALRALVAAGLPPPEGSNPLPDVWIVRLKPDAVIDGSRPLSELVTETRQQLAALPRVASTRTDERWNTAVDGGARTWADASAVWRLGCYGALAALLASAAFVGGIALRPQGHGTPIVLALTMVSTAILFLSTAAIALGIWIVATKLNATGSRIIESAWGLMPEKSIPLAVIAAGSWLVLVTAIVVGGHRKS